jgi:hypothetical protein
MNHLEPVTSFSIPSGMGGVFTVSIIDDLGDKARVRIWHGQPTAKGWKSWGDFDGKTRIVDKNELKNEKPLKMVRKVEDQNAGFFFVMPFEAEDYSPAKVVKQHMCVYPDSDVFRVEELSDRNDTLKAYVVGPEQFTDEQIRQARERQHDTNSPWVEC